MSKQTAPDEREQPEERSLILPDEELPETIAIIPVHDRPMFPKMVGPVVLDDPKLASLVLKFLQEERPLYFGVLLRKTKGDRRRTPTSAEDFYTMGTAARVMQVSPPEEGRPLQVVARATTRFAVKKMVKRDKLFFAEVEYCETTGDPDSEESKAYAGAIIDCIRELVSLNPLFKEGLSLLIERINLSDPATLADFASSMTTTGGRELQKILETLDLRTRLEAVLVLLRNELEITRLKAKISSRIEEQLSKQQREFFLRQQLKEIKKELGLAKEDNEAELEKFARRLKKIKPSAEAKARIKEEMEKMRLLGPSSPEFNVSRNYLDWLTALPWGRCSDESCSVSKARKILNRDHTGLDEVKERILELISVGRLRGSLSGTILLLQGPPGVGKTSIGRSVAESLGRSFSRFSVGGMRDEAEIKGHRRTYIGAMPGKFIQTIKNCGTANPVIMLDEIDKIGASFRGDPASALLEVLDPEQNSDFLDHYLDVRFDLSKVLFICTANQLDTIPAPLLDRMELIRLSGYILEEKVEIAKQHLVPRQLKEHGLSARQVRLSRPLLAEIVDGWAREAGVRGLENCIKKILRKVAARVLDEPKRQVRLHKKALPELLGRRRFSNSSLFATPRIGVVNGLAWTSMGGVMLAVEAVAVTTGRSGFKQTGQLGAVMVESSEIAFSHVRTLAEEKGERRFFRDSMIHLHVPAGATPKDGPSAGITMACAIYSLMTQQPVREGIAMTGELSLTGCVMPIGGVREKMIAARRAKVAEVILPAENRKDFEELPQHIQSGITPHFVSTFAEVQQLCFGG